MTPFFFPHPPPGASEEVLANYQRLIDRQDRENWILLWLHIGVFAICLVTIAAVPFIFPKGLC